MNDIPKTTAKDFFLYLGAMVALYVSAISFLVLLFQFVNVTFPDTLHYYSSEGARSAMRFSVAVLVVFFPLYIYLTRLVNNDIQAHPKKRGLRVRTWLLYLTLFVSGITLAIDVVVLINTFLRGDLTVRFLLKVLAVLAVALAVFGYYIADLRGRWVEKRRQSKRISYGVSFVVLAAVVIAFVVVGSPQAQRQLRLDEERIRDLQAVQSQIISHYRFEAELPETLADLNIGDNATVDPQSGEPYRYSRVSPTAFELCAVFARSSEDETATRGIPFPEPIRGDVFVEPVSWEHPAGEHCFAFEINPEALSGNE